MIPSWPNDLLSVNEIIKFNGYVTLTFKMKGFLKF